MPAHTTTRLAAVLWAASALCAPSPAQAPFDFLGTAADTDVWKPPVPARALRGRFLHVTDMHPDPFYVAGVSTAHACHRAGSHAKKGARSGAYGSPGAGCDAPFALVNATIAHLAREWADAVDFVVWTGDSARHDNDRRHPRTPREIYDLNRMVAGWMRDAFSRRGIPVIPSLGNNDIWPHNIMAPGPNEITREYSTIWKSFMPSHSFQVFQRGAYFSTEVVPDALAVISLNTLYFYDSNKAVGGCEWSDRNDAGNLEFDWLEVELSSFRSRGMYVYLTGHVPPSPGNYFPECYVRYTELALRFQDTILGHLFGHMNVDHFFFLEAGDLALPADDNAAPRGRAAAAADLFATLMDDFGALPRRKATDEANFVPVNVGPSVVPEYLPTFRVFAYNATGRPAPPRATKGRHHGHHRGPKADKQRCKDAPWRDTWRCRLTEKWHSDPDSPVRTNGRWTPLGFAQYFFPDAAARKAGKPVKFELEYTTFHKDALRPANGTDAGAFLYPIPPVHLPRSVGEKAKWTPYKMEDLTVRSWMKLARKLADGEANAKLRERFRTYMTVGLGAEEAKAAGEGDADSLASD